MLAPVKETLLRRSKKALQKDMLQKSDQTNNKYKEHHRGGEREREREATGREEAKVAGGREAWCGMKRMEMEGEGRLAISRAARNGVCLALTLRQF